MPKPFDIDSLQELVSCACSRGVVGKHCPDVDVPEQLRDQRQRQRMVRSTGHRLLSLTRSQGRW